MKRIKISILLTGVLLFLFSCNKEKAKETTDLVGNTSQVAKVSLRNSEGKFELLVNNEPFYIKGAGLEFGSIPSLIKHKANSFRTWRTENGVRSGKEVLDEAHDNGLMVSMCIDLARERHGFDYNDEAAVLKQKNEVEEQVKALKDHPALLMWIIGNELNLSYTNPKVWDAVNDISKMIHEMDSNHLTTTTLAGISRKDIDLIKSRSSDLDLLSIQMYGDLPNLPKLIKEFKWEGAYMVTEWGATGHWEVPTTQWGAPIEDNSTVKAANYLKRFKGGIEADSLQCIGSYVFLWENKQERTPTWYGVFLEDGRETESVDVMHYIWNGEWPENRTPQIRSFKLNGGYASDNINLKVNESNEASLEIFDFENDPIKYEWEILEESEAVTEGGDHEDRPDKVDFEIIKEEGGRLTFKFARTGNYRLFAYADDGNGHAATANIPFKVGDH